jgi:hypothetical protein
MEIDLPPPVAADATVHVGFLLRPEQVAWIKAHAGRSASRFMRELIDQLIEQEQREVRRLLDQRQQRQQQSQRSCPSGVIG